MEETAPHATLAGYYGWETAGVQDSLVVAEPAATVLAGVASGPTRQRGQVGSDGRRGEAPEDAAAQGGLLIGPGGQGRFLAVSGGAGGAGAADRSRYVGRRAHPGMVRLERPAAAQATGGAGGNAGAGGAKLFGGSGAP